MKIKSIVFGFLVGFVALSACKKTDPTITAAKATADFEVTQVVSYKNLDTLPWTTTITIKNKSSKDVFLSSWAFGDGGTSLLANPTHTYVGGGFNDQQIVTLQAVGPGGTSVKHDSLVIPDPCDNINFQYLTGCGARTWKLSPGDDAVSWSFDGGVSYFNAPPPLRSKYHDDKYTFTHDGKFQYDAIDSTYITDLDKFVPAINNASSYLLVTGKNGGNPYIVLDSIGLDSLHTKVNPFMGVTSKMVGNRYEIVKASKDSMWLKSQWINSFGTNVIVLCKYYNGLPPIVVRLLLNAGSKKTWRLDSVFSHKAVIVGTEGWPNQYYDATNPLAGAQVDDEYTFKAPDSLIYNAHGSTFNVPAGSYGNGPDESFHCQYTFLPKVSGGLSGLAQINLPIVPSDALLPGKKGHKYFLGIYDTAPENVYRILDLSDDAMTIRSGNTAGGVRHTMKFVKVTK